jgi:hypothetical protein
LSPRLRRLAFGLGCALLLASCGGGGGGGGESAGIAGPLGSSQSAIWVTPTQSWWIGTADDFEPADLHPVYTLTNIGSAPLEWNVAVSESWLSIPGATQGELQPGESVQVTFAVDAYAAEQDGIGPAVGLIDFHDSQSGTELAQRVVLVDSSFTDWSDDGWTTFTPSPDTRKVYVSPSGNNGFDGLSPAKAKLTIAAGIALLRNGYPDWLLLERGGVWHEALGHWKLSGRSASEPMLVGTYGTNPARPKLLTGLSHGIYTNGGGGSPAHIDCLALVGLEFVADLYTGTTDQIGAQMLQPGAHFLIEDCLFRGFGCNLVFQGYGGRHSDFRLRRSVIVDAWAQHSVGHSQGLYAYAVDGLLIEDNVFDHNGWNEAVPGAGADIFNHNLYIDNDNTGVVVRGNVIANASSHGMQLRPGGVCVNNLFVRNSIALSVGGGTHPEASGVIGEIHQNVILDGKNIDPANPRGWALWFGNIVSGHVSDNVVANNVSGTSPMGLGLDGDVGVGIHDLVLEHNVVHDWGGNVNVSGTYGDLSNITFQDNDVQDHTHPHPLIDHPASGSVAALTSSGNRCYSQQLSGSQWTKIGSTLYALNYWKSLVGDATTVAEQVEYVDPTRSPASYNALLGGAASLGAFLAQARLQSSTNWKPEYTAVHANEYLRAGFEPASP